MNPLLILFAVVAVVVIAIMAFVSSELLTYNLLLFVQSGLRDSRRRCQDLKNKIAEAMEAGRTIPNGFEANERLIKGAELSTEEAQKAIDLDPTNKKSWRSAKKFLKAAERQLDAVDRALSPRLTMCRRG